MGLVLSLALLLAIIFVVGMLTKVWRWPRLYNIVFWVLFVGGLLLTALIWYIASTLQ